MGADDKAQNTKDSMVGKGKETIGSTTGNESMENEGKSDQTKSDMKQAGEKVKDAFNKK
ncbi:CsbD family protein [soil metagenome]